MEICLLGTVELHAAGRREGFGSDKERCFLASLAYEVGRPVPLTTLADRLWDGHPPAQVSKSLHSYASRIRKAVRAEGGRTVADVVQRAHTYALETDRETVDLHRFQLRTAEARARADAGDDIGALALFRAAEPLWRGEPLAGLPGAWARRVRMELAEKKKANTLVRVVSDLRLDRFAEVVGEISALADQHPDDEAVTGRLMLALYGCGRRAEALDAYQRALRRLRSEHGSTPSDELRHLQLAILARVPVSELVPSGATGVQGEPPAPPHNIPRHMPLVGRGEEMRALLASLDSAQASEVPVVALEAIAGMAGVGKSTLAFHAAHLLRERFPDAQLSIDLQAHSATGEPLGPHVALASLLRMLRVPAKDIPHDLNELTALWRTVLAHRRAVIVLDDAADTGQVRPLLPGASPSLVIITSRHRLAGLPGVHKVSLGVLPPDEAIGFFRNLVGEERSDDAGEVAGIVRLLGYLPLAIEIIGTRFDSHPSWSVRDLRERLSRTEGRLGEIRDGSREIARAFEFSYLALSRAERSAFRLLGLHLGPDFGPHAAAALTGLPLGGAERMLELLLNCHLLQEPIPHRYRFHDLLGEYARSLTAEEDSEEKRDLAMRRLIDFYLGAADQADRRLYPHRPRIDVGVGADVGHPPHQMPTWPIWHGWHEVRAWFSAERINLLALVQHAWTHGHPRAAALLTHVLSGFLDEECYWTEAAPFLGQATDYWHEAGDRYAESRALVDLSANQTRAGRYREAAQTARRAAAIAVETGDSDSEAAALHQLGVIIWHQGELQDALLLQQEVIDIRLAAGDRRELARSLNNSGITLLHLGEYRTAMGCFRGALRGFLGIGDRRDAARVTNNMGDLYLSSGDKESARQSYEKASDMAAAVGSRADQQITRANLAHVLQELGELEKALVLHREVASSFHGLGDKRNESVAINSVGTTLRMTDRLDEAVASHERALELARSIGAALEEAEALRCLGIAEHQLGRLEAADEHLTAALVLARRIHAPEGEARALEALAEVRFACGRLELARELLENASGIFDLLDPVEAGRLRRIVRQRFIGSA